ncbi:hypothetical protein [Paenibacillus radicis (ex Gao et al. 2016)]|uniref:Uncharacterized protein n=1 Tax=Paenibacillus radicis (ex Gao et al. 2016) TaxID=1737354 RepID=A0A917MAB0_9BACL|nr:hypothetical protein [Paenibacillus radicis (ex Gao et al. 2016)]GGG84959.1 hypothetical protein GCM10010918_48600 [Paenibacillus radicis (ex Gao et al. 2016)]
MPSVMIVLAAALWGTAIVRHRMKLKQVRESVWAIAVLVMGVVYCLCLLKQVNVPNPVDWITALYEPLCKPIIDWVMEGSSE